jgi:hypothetical protein
MLNYILKTNEASWVTQFWNFFRLAIFRMKVLLKFQSVDG